MRIGSWRCLSTSLGWDQVDDLLNSEQQNLKVRQDQHTKMGWYVEQLTWRECKTPESLIEAFDDGRKRLKYAETHMNKHSSRSHAVMQLKVAKRPQGTCSAASPGGDATFKRLMGKMTIVDLAGSERVKKSQHGCVTTRVFSFHDAVAAWSGRWCSFA